MKLSMLSEAFSSPKEAYRYWMSKSIWRPKKRTRANRRSKTDKLLLQMAGEGKDKPDENSLDPHQRFLGVALQRLLELPKFRRRMLKANRAWVS
jgi:hypothetical protein